MNLADNIFKIMYLNERFQIESEITLKMLLRGL